MEILRKTKGSISIKEISQMTSIKVSSYEYCIVLSNISQTEDILQTLQSLNLIRYHKGQHVLALTPKILEDHAKAMQKQTIKIDPKCLHWTPLVMGKKKVGY